MATNLNVKTSIVDFLKSQGRDSSFGARTKLAESFGIKNYVGSAQQNIQLLKLVSGSTQPITQPQVAQPQAQQRFDITGLSKVLSIQDEASRNLALKQQFPDVTNRQGLTAGSGFTATANVRKNVEFTLPSAIEPGSNNFFGEPVTNVDFQKIIDRLTSQAPPTLPNLISDFEAFRSEQGIPALETQLNTINTDLENAEAGLRLGLQEAEGKQVSTRVISQEQLQLRRQAQEDIDFLVRRKNSVINELNVKNSMVSNLMKLTQQDFVNASAQYNTEFAKNVQLISIMQNYQNQQQAEQNRLRDDARANADFMISIMVEKGLTFNDLSPDSKQLLSSLGTRSGFGSSFFAEILNTATAQGKPIQTTIVSQDKSQVSILYKDGTIQTAVSTGITPSGGAGGEFTLSAGQIRFDAQGNIVARGGEKAEKPLTQSQFTAKGFATRMQQANEIIIGLDEEGFEPGRIQAKLPNFLKSENQQLFEQAQRNFINAILRRESGAAIAPSEFESAELQYFPQPGDEEAVLKQKAQNRSLVITNMLEESGGQLGEPDIEGFRSQLRPGEFLAREISTGNIVAITSPEFIPGKYEIL